MTNSADSSPTDRVSTDPAARPRKRFSLTGHSATLDPAVDAVRDDLADVTLADRVFAPHYAEAVPYTAIADALTHSLPKVDAPVVETLQIGAPLDLFDLNGGWGWVRTGRGMGYVAADCIAPA